MDPNQQIKREPMGMEMKREPIPMEMGEGEEVRQPHLVAALSTPHVQHMEGAPQGAPMQQHHVPPGYTIVPGPMRPAHPNQNIISRPYPPPQGVRPGPPGHFQQFPPPGANVQIRHIAPPPMMGAPSGMPPVAVPPHIGQPQLPTTDGSIIDKVKLDELVRQIEPNTVLEEPVKDALLEYTEEFVDDIVDRVCRLVQHRANQRLEVRDVEFVLDTVYKMPRVPRSATHIFGGNPPPGEDKTPSVVAHQHRLALIKKQLKKV